MYVLANNTRVVPYFYTRLKIWYNPCIICQYITAKQLKTMYYSLMNVYFYRMNENIHSSYPKSHVLCFEYYLVSHPVYYHNTQMKPTYPYINWPIRTSVMKTAKKRIGLLIQVIICFYLLSSEDSKCQFTIFLFAIFRR